MTAYLPLAYSLGAVAFVALGWWARGRVQAADDRADALELQHAREQTAHALRERDEWKKQAHRTTDAVAEVGGLAARAGVADPVERLRKLRATTRRDPAKAAGGAAAADAPAAARVDP